MSERPGGGPGIVRKKLCLNICDEVVLVAYFPHTFEYHGIALRLDGMRENIRGLVSSLLLFSLKLNHGGEPALEVIVLEFTNTDEDWNGNTRELGLVVARVRR